MNPVCITCYEHTGKLDNLLRSRPYLERSEQRLLSHCRLFKKSEERAQMYIIYFSA